MPAFYAHHRFGEKVLPLLDDEIRELILNYRDSFNVGLQGPDLLTYYQPHQQNRVATYGFHLQELSAYPFFQNALKIIKKQGRATREYAYILGVICHYILDSECHPYINRKTNEINVPHREIESEFEKALLRTDEKDPFTYPLYDLVPTDDKTAASTYAFYKNINPVIIKQALQDMRMIKKLYTSPGKAKQKILNTVFSRSKNTDYWNGLIHHKEDNPACETSTRGLMLRFDNAVLLAAKMIDSFDESLTAKKELHIRFNRTYN